MKIVTASNVAEYAAAHALIIGSHFKHDGYWPNDICTNRLTTFMNAVRALPVSRNL